MDDRSAAIILAGGQGTRIRELFPNVPKPLIPAAGEPFIEWVLRHASTQGIGRFVISLGHLAEVGQDYFRNRAPDGLTIRTVVEREPLGTGGAVEWAQRTAASNADPLVILNGDSLVLADYAPAWRLLEDPQVDGALLGVEMDDASRYGRIDVDARGWLLGFREKHPGAGLINAGVYFLRRRLLAQFPQRRPLSLEIDVFPRLVANQARLAVAACQAPFIDIGTPQTAREVDRFIARHFKDGVPQ